MAGEVIGMTQTVTNWLRHDVFHGVSWNEYTRTLLERDADPDECYYVNTPPPPPAQGSAPLDLSTYPPPDLAIEIEVSQSSVPKQPICAALGVAELWRYDGERIRPLLLNAGGKYAPAEKSLAFPNLPIVHMNHFLQLALTTTHHAAAKAIRDYARTGKI
jgi:Uma2 family endonuclease